MIIEKTVKFCAAHHIPGAGKCSRNHGHNWEAVINVEMYGGWELDDKGFVVDVRDLKQAAYAYDHEDLNNFFTIPSTENVAKKIAEDVFNMVIKAHPNATFSVEVELIETEENVAIVVIENC